MIHFTCDLCGKALLADEETRYIAKIEVYAAYDPMEITGDDLEKDHEDEMQSLLDEMADMDAEELEGQVYQSFRFDLCPKCRAAFVRDPLGKGMRLRARFEHN
jgi:hypothetical protein